MTEQERTRRLLLHIQAAQRTLEQYGMPQRYPAIVGALLGMLEGMAGFGPYDNGHFPPLLSSLFDPTVTEAIKSLLMTIEDCLGPMAPLAPPFHTKE